MGKKKKSVQIKPLLPYIGLALYLAAGILLVVFLPKIMSGGDPAVEIVLTTGRTAIITETQIDISAYNEDPDHKPLKTNDKVYLINGVDNAVKISRKKTSGATIAIVEDLEGNTAKIKQFSYPDSQASRFSFGMTFFRILIAAALLMFPTILIIRARDNGSFDLFDFSKKGSGKHNKSKVTKKYGDQGTAKIGTLKDMSSILGDGGFTLSMHARLTASASYEHVLVLGPTGSGKSTSFFIPNLLDLDGIHSAVVTDPKGEMCELTRGYLESKGYRIVKIKPLEPNENEYKYNPILLTEGEEQMHAIAQILLINGGKSIEVQTGASSGNAEWVNMSVPLLTAALAYVVEFGEKKSIPEAIEIIMKDDLNAMERKFKMSDYAYRQFLAFKASAGSEKTLSSIKTVLTSNVQIFFDTKIAEFVTSDFTKLPNGSSVVNQQTLLSPLMLREKPTVLFLCIPENQANYMMPLTSVMYYQLLNIPITHAEGSPILFFFDEFPNSGFVLNMNTTISTCRSRKMGVAICAQNIEQLDLVYGKEIAATILNNLKTKLFYSGLTGDSAKYVSDMAGSTTVETKNFQSGNSGGGKGFAESLFSGFSPSVSKSGVRRELLTTDEVRTMDSDQVLMIAHNINPVFDTKNAYYLQQRYNDKVKIAPQKQ